MTTNFPTSLDALTNPTAGDATTSPSHAAQHANANDAIEAIEAKVGVNSSAVTTSIDYKLGDVMRLIVRKTADETVTSSTTLQNDNDLILPVTGSEIYQVEFRVIFSGANTTGDIKCAFTFPTSGRIDMMGMWAVTGAGFAGDEVHFNGTSSPTTARTFQGRGTSIRTPMIIQGVYANGGTGGNLTLQWAQNTSSGTATTVYANSTLWGCTLA